MENKINRKLVVLVTVLLLGLILIGTLMVINNKEEERLKKEIKELEENGVVEKSKINYSEKELLEFRKLGESVALGSTIEDIVSLGLPMDEETSKISVENNKNIMSISGSNDVYPYTVNYVFEDNALVFMEMVSEGNLIYSENINEDRKSSVKEGMTLEEVISILGEEYFFVYKGNLNNKDIEEYGIMYLENDENNNAKTLMIKLENNKVSLVEYVVNSYQ